METVIAEYIWIDVNSNLRSKNRTIIYQGNLEFPEWNFDGSSTGQAEVANSEIVLKPRAYFIDPFMTEKIRKIDEINNYKCYLVLCDCYDKDDNPAINNNRFNANLIFEKVKESEIWFGIEQEYIIYDKNFKSIVGWPKNGFPEPQGKYYCSIGADRAFGREMVDEHYLKCLQAGIKICGTNAEVLPGQWEFQIGICEGITAADHLWIARFILVKVCEKYGFNVSFDPKPFLDWNGSGLHTNFSTKEIRESEGLNELYNAINKLGTRHHDHIKVYGDNSKRLSGKHETSDINEFTFGIGDRSSSIRIPSNINKTKNKYLEDRRPSSNADPYLVTSIIAETVLLF
jgi:glutamine synthetase